VSASPIPFVRFIESTPAENMPAALELPPNRAHRDEVRPAPQAGEERNMLPGTGVVVRTCIYKTPIVGLITARGDMLPGTGAVVRTCNYKTPSVGLITARGDRYRNTPWHYRIVSFRLNRPDAERPPQEGPPHPACQRTAFKSRESRLRSAPKSKPLGTRLPPSPIASPWTASGRRTEALP
jgi:hypothetical protein